MDKKIIKIGLRTNVKFIRNIKYLTLASPIPLVLISCAPAEFVIEYQDVDPSFSKNLAIGTEEFEEVGKRTRYLGDNDNELLNFGTISAHISYISVIDSVQALEYHFENHYFTIKHSYSTLVKGKYKYWDNFFITPEEKEELKSKYNEEFFKTKILVIDAGWYNSSKLSVPKFENSDKKLLKEHFYEKIISKNNSHTSVTHESFFTTQVAYFYELIKKDWFEDKNEN